MTQAKLNIVKPIILKIFGEKLYRSILGHYKTYQIKTKKWYDIEIEIIPFAVKADESVLDIGANFGLYSYYMSKALKGRGVCYSFEPIPYTYSILEKICKNAKLKNVKLINKGVGEKIETLQFSVPKQGNHSFNTGLSHIHTGVSREKQKFNERYAEYELVLCDIVAIDQFVSKEEVISLMKLDIEGAELMALKGAQETINNNYPTITCEISQYCLDIFKVTKEDVALFLLGKNYKMYKFNKIQFKLNELNIHQMTKGNYVFIHPSRLDRFKSLL